MDIPFAELTDVEIACSGRFADKFLILFFSGFPPTVHSGAVILMQRFGSALKLNNRWAVTM
jgi:hypothetical protein